MDISDVSTWPLPLQLAVIGVFFALFVWWVVSTLTFGTSSRKENQDRDEMFEVIAEKYGLEFSNTGTNTQDPLTNEDQFEIRKLYGSVNRKAVVIQDLQFRTGETDANTARSISGFGGTTVFMPYTRFSLNGVPIKAADATFFGIPIGDESISAASEKNITDFIDSQ